MKKNRIRPIALCVFCKNNNLLVAKNYDAVKQKVFYRPVGGGIDFGELGAEAIVREVREELGISIKNPRYIGTLENIFIYRGKPGHEMVQIYTADLPDASLYDKSAFIVMEKPDKAHHMEWIPAEFFLEGKLQLYPNGLLDLLSRTSLISSPSSEKPL